MSADGFGFTNDSKDIERVRQFVSDAVADGWSIAPTYKHEAVERAARLTRDGFVIQVLARTMEPGCKWKYEAQVNIWAPDGLAILPPTVYGFAEIERRTRKCTHCKAEDVKTVRYSFAGRCCETCLPAMRKKHEYPGWTN